MLPARAIAMLEHNNRGGKSCLDTNKAMTLLREVGFESSFRMDLSSRCDELSMQVVSMVRHMWDTVAIRTTISFRDRITVQGK